MPSKKDPMVKVSDAEYTGSKRGAHLPEEENPFTFRIKSGSIEEGADSGAPYIQWELTVEKGDFKGKRIFHPTTLQNKGLFNLRGMMEAAKVSVKDARASRIVKALTGKTFMANVMDDEYNDKIKSVIDDYVLEIPDEEDEDEEEEEAPRRRRGRRQREEAEDEDEETEADEDDEEEEEEKPARRSRSRKGSRSSRRPRRSRDDDDDEEDEGDLDDVELDDI